MRRLLPIALLLAAATLRAGLVENVAARSDPTQTYTLYLPSSYDASNPAPLLFVFDPRSRGTKAAEIFRDAAEEYGWILISSNQTRSDGSDEPNERAVRALLAEIPRYAVNPDRIYAAGFSGTAMAAWGVGIITGRLAGVIGVGGRLVDQVPPAKFNFAHYGFSGNRDFNNREMRMVDAALEVQGKVPHRFQTFDGEHRWIPPPLAREAIGWFEVLAGNHVDEVFARDVAAADALTGWSALRRYREIVRTFGTARRPSGRHEESVQQESAALSAIEEKIAKLEGDPAVQREIADEKEWDAFEAEYVSGVFARLPQLLAAMRGQEVPPAAADAERVFRVRDLRRRATRPGAEGATAKRILESVYAQASFYLMRQLFERREFPLAAALLGMAVTIHPDRWDSWYNLGAAQARAGNRRAAYDALAKAVGTGFHDGSQLQSDEDFASLRPEKKFQELVGLASRSQ